MNPEDTSSTIDFSKGFDKETPGTFLAGAGLQNQREILFVLKQLIPGGLRAPRGRTGGLGPGLQRRARHQTLIVSDVFILLAGVHIYSRIVGNGKGLSHSKAPWRSLDVSVAAVGWKPGP